jgi:energy-coupling factor transporter ATP-binding protein EcfA2
VRRVAVPHGKPLRMAMLFQRPFLLRLSVQANLRLALWLGGGGVSRRASAAGWRCSASASQRRRSVRRARCRGGQQQRLALARAWALQPDVLLLDEPTASLDPSAKREVEQLLAEFAEQGTTLLMASHNFGQVKRLAQRVGLSRARPHPGRCAAGGILRRRRGARGTPLPEGRAALVRAPARRSSGPASCRERAAVAEHRLRPALAGRHGAPAALALGLVERQVGADPRTSSDSPPAMSMSTTPKLRLSASTLPAWASMRRVMRSATSSASSTLAAGSSSMNSSPPTRPSTSRVRSVSRRSAPRCTAPRRRRHGRGCR